jgi:hypothetical protein
MAGASTDDVVDSKRLLKEPVKRLFSTTASTSVVCFTA